VEGAVPHAFSGILFAILRTQSGYLEHLPPPNIPERFAEPVIARMGFCVIIKIWIIKISTSTGI
jgi:hypothetical protein